MQSSYKDPQTGFYEFQLFRELFQREVDRSRRYARPLSLLVGRWEFAENTREIPLDSVLLWASLARDVDFSTRMSRACLLTVLPETDRPGASVAAERFSRSFEREGLSEALQLGLATFPMHGRTVDELLVNGEICAGLSRQRLSEGPEGTSSVVGSRV